MVQVRVEESGATAAESASARRQSVIEDLAGLEEAAAAVRGNLAPPEDRVSLARRHLESGGPAADLPRVAHVMEERAAVNAALAEMQQARHRSQRSLFLLAVDEGFSLAEIARTWGISRQLVSRMTREEPGHGAPA
jgi:DNA-directed RNA polymerase specialized sigma24 family protein